MNRSWIGIREIYDFASYRWKARCVLKFEQVMFNGKMKYQVFCYFGNKNLGNTPKPSIGTHTLKKTCYFSKVTPSDDWNPVQQSRQVSTPSVEERVAWRGIPGTTRRPQRPTGLPARLVTCRLSWGSWDGCLVGVGFNTRPKLHPCHTHTGFVTLIINLINQRCSQHRI